MTAQTDTPREPPDITKEVEFDILREDWMRYKLKDLTLLRVRIAVLKLVPTRMGELGTPEFGILSQNIVSAVVPSGLLKKGGPTKGGPLTAQDIREGTDLDFQSVGEPKWQEYKTSDGWIVMLRPEVEKAVRLKYYNDVGEPIYWVHINPVSRVKKAE